MLPAPETEHGHGLSLEIFDRANSIIAEQLEATGMNSGQHHCRISRIQLDEKRRGESHGEVGLTSAESLVHSGATGEFQVAYSIEALRPQQIFGDVLRRYAEAGGIDQGQFCGLRSRFRSQRPRVG